MQQIGSGDSSTGGGRTPAAPREACDVPDGMNAPRACAVVTPQDDGILTAKAGKPPPPTPTTRACRCASEDRGLAQQQAGALSLGLRNTASAHCLNLIGLHWPEGLVCHPIGAKSRPTCFLIGGGQLPSA